jgi:hypothetical protein
LAISFELNEIWDPQARQDAEAVIRECLGEGPREQNWKVWLHASADYCHVIVEGPDQRRERFFFGGLRLLPGEIREWLELYPFR